MPPKKKEAPVKEGDEKQMGGIVLRAVKGPDGKIVWKPAATLDAKPKATADDEKRWLKEKERAVADARVQERKGTNLTKKKEAATIYGAQEVFTGRGRKGGSGRTPHVEPSSYLKNLRLEEEAARRANMPKNKPGQYQIIKESLEAEEKKFSQITLKAREKAYERSQRRHGVHIKGGDGGYSSSEEEKEMSEEEFKRAAQARAAAADKELARDGVKLRAPIPKREEEEAKAKAKIKEDKDRKEDRRQENRRREKEERTNAAAARKTPVYVDPLSEAAREQARTEAGKWQELKDQSEASHTFEASKAPPSSKGGKRGKGGGKSKPGDWICPACNANNFASRHACYKCGAAKPASAASAAGGSSGGSGRGRGGGGKGGRGLK